MSNDPENKLVSTLGLFIPLLAMNDSYNYMSPYRVSVFAMFSF